MNRSLAHPPRGAALLLAMVILTLVATLAAGMVWQQTRAVSIEAAERARTQAGWVLAGALDWARVILREDGRNAGADDLGEPWATPLAEARLSSFLSADRQNNADSTLEAFLSGGIEDAQARYNLLNLFDNTGKPVPAEIELLGRLCEMAGVPADTAGRLAEGLRRAGVGIPGAGAEGTAAPLAPHKISQLVWLGLDAGVVERLVPFVVLLPRRTPVNANTAPREVLVAVLGVDSGTAERLVQQRLRTPFKSMEALRAALPQGLEIPGGRVAVATSFFFVRGRLRLEERVLEEHSLVERRSGQVSVLSRERRSLQIGG